MTDVSDNSVLLQQFVDKKFLKITRCIARCEAALSMTFLLGPGVFFFTFNDFFKLPREIRPFAPALSGSITSTRNLAVVSAIGAENGWPEGAVTVASGDPPSEASLLVLRSFKKVAQFHATQIIEAAREGKTLKEMGKSVEMLTQCVFGFFIHAAALVTFI